jgi:nitrogen fixation/metabolism regulation signal transduction histidine kinase
MINAARGKGYAAIEGEVDGDPHMRGEKGALRLRIVQRIPGASLSMTRLDNPAERFLQLTAPVPPALARNADAVQRAYREYQEKSLGRAGLRKMYIGTLTLALFLASFVSIMLALALGNQLARPLFLLAQGTKEVTAGDYRPKREIRSRDELGFLTQSFNAMTRQLSDAHIAVEKNRIALEHSNAYLESILENLTAGVFVLDRQFRLQTTNPGAERIFHQSFRTQLGTPLDQIAALSSFSAMARKAFADHAATSDKTSRDDEDLGHWQQQLSVPLPGDADPLTLLVRGSRLASSARAASPMPPDAVNAASTINAANPAPGKPVTAGYVIVFDDISDVISAQRSIAWGEVARRLAHEIRNPLTPIQLSAERLQRKLADRLAPADAEVLRRGANTIVSQVQAMKQMVNDFRDYARTPPAMLTPLQLNDLVSEVMTLYGVEESRSGIHVALAPLPMIRGDATQLRQVIHNLLQNAQDAVADVPSPRVVLETRAVEYGDADNDADHVRTAVRLTVSDNGPGFSSGLLTRAFEPYVTTKAKGTGLGLAVVRKIIDEHGARIDLRNRTKADGSVGGAQISILFLQLASETGEPDSTIPQQTAVTSVKLVETENGTRADNRGINSSS